ncbi:hypothetical protein B0H10DRAFT_2315790 [Mycena sp. CBHHK59/15]|nr:hypothetical protein B0H10DRAFT_2315790 [Mycena sp. CBHHK59/15]
MTRNCRARYLPLNFNRFLKATRHSLTGTKRDMHGAIQPEITHCLELLNPSPDGLLLNHEGTPGKKVEALGFGVNLHVDLSSIRTSTECRGCQTCRGRRNKVNRLNEPLDHEVLTTPWLANLFNIRRELAPVPRCTVSHQNELPNLPVAPSTNAQHIPLPVTRPASLDSVLDITVPVTVVGWVADFELPEVFDIFPRTENGRLYLQLDDFEATFKWKGFATDIELYLGDGYMAWIAWPLDQPLPIDGPNEIAILRSHGLNYLEGWNNHL